MSPPPSVKALILLFLSLTLAFAEQTEPLSHSSNLVDKVCKQTKYYDFCVRQLDSNPARAKADLAGLGVIAIDQGIAKAKSTFSYIQELQNKTENPSLLQALGDCSELYVDAIDQLEDSKRSIELKDYADANMWVSASMADSDTCEEGFAEQEEALPSPLSKNNSQLSKLGSIALAIIKLLK
ncbi:hypothetical protein AMTRI_Chr02g262300 [Amborella trichopoda]